jgi:hypothetical protein
MYNKKIKTSKMKNFRINLRNVAIIFACLAVMTACNSGNKQNAAQQSDSEKTEAVTTTKSNSLEVKDINTGNWQSVVKAKREGLEIPLPEGWTVESAKPETRSSSRIIITFNIGGSTTAEQFGQMLLDATKAIAKNGNHKTNVTANGAEEGDPVNTFSDAAMIGGESFPAEWIFTAYYKYTVYCYADMNKKQVAINL